MSSPLLLFALALSVAASASSATSFALIEISILPFTILATTGSFRARSAMMAIRLYLRFLATHSRRRGPKDWGSSAIRFTRKVDAKRAKADEQHLESRRKASEEGSMARPSNFRTPVADRQNE